MSRRFAIAILTGVAATALLSAPSAFASESITAVSSNAAPSNSAPASPAFALRGPVGDALPELSSPAPAIASLVSIAQQDAPLSQADAAPAPVAREGVSLFAEDEDARTQMQSPPATTTASALPWYERFTTAPPTQLNTVWGEQADSFRVTTGDRWGFSLGVTERPRGPQFDVQDLSAGAFFEVSPRLRLGADLRFSNPEEDIFGEEVDQRSPEIKFESAFRF